MATGFGIAETVRMWQQRVVGPCTELEVRGRDIHLGQVSDASAAGKAGTPRHLEDPKNPNLDTEHVAGTGHDTLHVTPPGALHRERSGRTDQLTPGSTEHQGDLETRHQPHATRDRSSPR